MSLQRDHVVIVHRRYADKILRGHKTIECRLSAARIAPFGRATRGDTLHFKASGGTFFARATVSQVRFIAIEGAGGIERIREQHDGRILGDDGYWDSKADAKFASLIWFKQVRSAARTTPIYPAGSRSAWHIVG